MTDEFVSVVDILSVSVIIEGGAMAAVQLPSAAV